MSHSPNMIKIDLSALEYNLDQVKQLVNKGTKIMGVVKSDAYGHGLVPVSRVLEKNGVDCLGVAHIQEALELRKNGIGSPIVILCGIQTREDAMEVVDKSLTPVLSDVSLVEILAQEGAKRNTSINVQLKVDTGMSRLGVPYGDVGPFVKKILEHKELYLEALCSHLSSADETVSDFTKIQIERFKKAIETGHSMGIDLPLNNLANSAGLMAHKDSHFNMVRPGIMLYGGLPSPGFDPPRPLEPVMRFEGRILQIKDYPKDTPISYGRSYYTKGDQRIAVISAGYGDGLPRNLSNRGKVLIRGKKLNIVGRVCMNMTMCDITGMKDIEQGDEVILMGRQGEEIISGDDLAIWGETISYEIFCSIGQRDTKEYIS